MPLILIPEQDKKGNYNWVATQLSYNNGFQKHRLDATIILVNSTPF